MLLFPMDSYSQVKISCYKFFFPVILFCNFVCANVNLTRTCDSDSPLTSGDVLPARVIPVGAFSEKGLFSPRLTVQFHSPERNLSEVLAGIREQAWGWSTFLIDSFPFIPGTQHFRKIIHSLQ